MIAMLAAPGFCALDGRLDCVRPRSDGDAIEGTRASRGFRRDAGRGRLDVRGTGPEGADDYRSQYCMAESHPFIIVDRIASRTNACFKHAGVGARRHLRTLVRDRRIVNPVE